MCHCSHYLLALYKHNGDRLHCKFLPQGISELFEKIKQENKANGHMGNDPGLFFTNLYVTPVLKNISLYLEKGNMLAVAGSTGAGKVSQMLPYILLLLSQIVPKEVFSIVLSCEEENK